MNGLRGLAGMRIVVTGAANGIGHAIATRLAGEGARLGVLDRDAAGAEACAEELRGRGAEAHAFGVDVRDYSAVREAIDRFVQSCGAIDGLVNNAGWDRAAPFLETDPEFWREVIDINLHGPIHVTHAALAHMAAQGRGRIVSIASDAGRVGSSGEAVYSACKAGMIAFSKSVAREQARSGITLNAVSPGPTDTAFFAAFDATGRLQKSLERAIPMGRLGRPDDYPGAVAFLLSDDAAFITGQTLSVSGGLTMHS